MVDIYITMYITRLSFKWMDGQDAAIIVDKAIIDNI